MNEADELWKDMIETKGRDTTKKLYGTFCKRRWILTNFLAFGALVINALSVRNDLVVIGSTAVLIAGNIYYLHKYCNGWDFDARFGSDKI